MESFEIYITGDDKIITELEKLQIKSIIVGLLTNKGELIREEYMSSTIQKFNNLDDCIKWTNALGDMLESKGVKIIRKKIECQPDYYHYTNRVLYMEAHWKIDDIVEYKIFPISKNMKSGKMMATHRVYDHKLFPTLKKMDEAVELELCVMDTYISEDFDWFSHYMRV